MPRPIAAVLLPALTGVLLILSFPGFNHGQAAWVALVPLLASLPGSSSKGSFSRGFLAGLVGNLGALSWVYSTCRRGGVNPPVSALAWAALSAYGAVYPGLFALACRRFERRSFFLRPLLVAAAWSGLELLRAHILTGFPWLLLGYSQWNTPPHLPLAEWGGPYAVSFMLALFNAAAAQIVVLRRGEKGRRILLSVLPSLSCLLLMLGGSVFLSRRFAPPPGPGVRIALVQGNIDQYKKWDRAYEQEIAGVYARLTRQAAAGGAEVILWPETSVPGWLPNDPAWDAWVSGLARETGKFLLVGAVTRDGGDYNAAFLYGPDGNIRARYRKRHLVPFGEFVPFKKILGRLTVVLNALGDFDASSDWTVFEVPGARFGADICFESLFPDLVRGFIRRGAGFTVNMTNDGWFPDTAAPEQHFAAAPFRAVENRTWVVAATNTGVSALVAPDGRVAARLSPGRPDVLQGAVVPDPRGTFYTRHGDLFAGACAVLSLLGLL